jgi:MFS family permease
MNDSSETRAQTFYPALALALMTAAFIISKTGRDALFFQGKGIFRLPVATMTITAASLPLAILFVKAMKSWGARRTRLGLLLFAGAALSLAAPFLEAGGSPLLFNVFIFIPSAFGIMFASLWLLAADIFETTAKPQAARAFSKIGASSLAGGMLGGFVAKGLSPLIEAKWLILVGALMIFLVALLVALTHRRFASNIVAKRDDKKKSAWFAPLANSYARILLVISMLGALAGLLIDVQFYISATGASMGSKGNANFFANFYIMLNFSSLLLQLFVTPKIQDKIGIGGGLMVLPLALAGSAGFASAAATAFSLSALRVTEGGLRSSIHRSIWEQAFIPIESGERFPDQCPCTTELGKGNRLTALALAASFPSHWSSKSHKSYSPKKKAGTDVHQPAGLSPQSDYPHDPLGQCPGTNDLADVRFDDLQRPSASLLGAHFRAGQSVADD